MKKIIILLLISFPDIAFSQNVGIGTTTPVTKLNIVGGSSSPAFPGVTSTALFRIGVGTAEGIDFGKMGSSPFSAWMQAGLNGAISDPLSLQPLGGNLGIGTVSPAEKLDVTGNINVTGTIKANGVDGTANQVLMKNSGGILAWGDMCEYKNFVSFPISGSSTWTVPAGVTKILVEVWGAGGGGNLLAGGGGGGYIKAHFTVTPGSVINYTIGTGGTGAVASSAVTGEVSTCTVNGNNLQATGGQGALYLSATNGQGGNGGSWSIIGVSNYIGSRGSPGESQQRSFSQFDAATFYERGEAGKGGNAANSNNTGGLGQYYLYNNTGSTLIYRNGNPSSGLQPGGGGSSGIQFGATALGGGNGGSGLITIYY